MKVGKHGDEAGEQSLVILTWLHVRLVGECGVCLDGAEEIGNGDRSIHSIALESQGSHLYLH